MLFAEFAVACAELAKLYALLAVLWAELAALYAPSISFCVSCAKSPQVIAPLRLIWFAVSVPFMFAALTMRVSVSTDDPLILVVPVESVTVRPSMVRDNSENSPSNPFTLPVIFSSSTVNSVDSPFSSFSTSRRICSEVLVIRERV